MNIQPFQGNYPNLDKVFSTDTFFSNIKNLYPISYQNGYYEKSKKPGFYVYQQYNGSRTFTGVITLTDIQHYLNGAIIKHEQTLSSKEAKQLKLLGERQGLIKPVLLTYDPVKKIRSILRAFVRDEDPLYTIHYRGVKNTFWQISDKKIMEQLISLFDEKVDKAYIADGHHRCATVANNYRIQKEKNPNHTGLETYNNLMTAYFDTEEVDIYDFSRIVKRLGDISSLQFLAALSQVCDIEATKFPVRPSKKGIVGMYLNKEWFKLRWKKGIKEKYKNTELFSEQLDVSILNEVVFCEILGVKNIKTTSNIDYIDGKKGMLALETQVNKYSNGIGFTMYPVDIKDFMKISDANEILPPKSTFFIPRMFNGFTSFRF